MSVESAFKLHQTALKILIYLEGELERKGENLGNASPKTLFLDYWELHPMSRLKTIQKLIQMMMDSEPTWTVTFKDNYRVELESKVTQGNAM